MAAAVNANKKTALTGADASLARPRIRMSKLGPESAIFSARRATRRCLPAFVQGSFSTPKAVNPIPATSWAIRSGWELPVCRNVSSNSEAPSSNAIPNSR